ncbi:MAG: hypothetical protein ACTIIT_08630 [Brevibacterium linens]
MDGHDPVVAVEVEPAAPVLVTVFDDGPLRPEAHLDQSSQRLRVGGEVAQCDPADSGREIPEAVRAGDYSRWCGHVPDVRDVEADRLERQTLPVRRGRIFVGDTVEVGPVRNVVAVEARDDHPTRVDGLVTDPFGQKVTGVRDVRSLAGDLLGQSSWMFDEDEDPEAVAVLGFEPPSRLGHRRSSPFLMSEEDEELFGLRRRVQQGADGVSDDRIGLVVRGHDDRVEQGRWTHDRVRIGTDFGDDGSVVGSTEPTPRMRQGRATVQDPLEVGQACRPVDPSAAAKADEAASDVDRPEHGADEHQPDDGEHVDHPEHHIDEREDEHEPDRSEADRRR